MGTFCSLFLFLSVLVLSVAANSSDRADGSKLSYLPYNGEMVPEVVVVVPYWLNGNSRQFLLISEEKTLVKNASWSLPTGTVEVYECLSQTASRVAREKAGVTGTAITDLGRSHFFEQPTKEGIKTSYRNMFLMEVTGFLEPNETVHENVWAEWVSLRCVEN